MKKYNTIILAGGEKGPLYDTTGYVEKALIPIRGKAMLTRVVETFHESSHVDKIVVVGSRNLESLPVMKHVAKRVRASHTLLRNILLGIGYVKHRIYHGRRRHDGYLISFCDAVFLTTEAVDETLQAIEDVDADIVLHYVEKSTFQKAGLPAKRTYIPIGDGLYTGSTIYYVRSFHKLFRILPLMGKLRKHRKDPQKMLELIGCEGRSVEEIEQAMSRKLKAKVRILVSARAELGMDVDKPSDLELAQRLLDSEAPHNYTAGRMKAEVCAALKRRLAADASA